MGLKFPIYRYGQSFLAIIFIKFINSDTTVKILIYFSLAILKNLVRIDKYHDAGNR